MNLVLPERAYQEAVREFRDTQRKTELQNSYRLPGLEISGTARNFDLEENLISLKPEKLAHSSFSELREWFFETLSRIREARVNSEALTRRARKDLRWLDNVYGVELGLDGAYFRHLDGNTLARSSRKDREFRIDRAYMDQFDPEEESFETDDPIRELSEQVERINVLLDEGRPALESRVSKVASTPLHEIRHWVSYELEQENLNWKKNRPDIEEISGESRSWGSDATVASLEAETTFDQFLYGYNGKKWRKWPLKAFHNPSDHKEFFRNHDDLAAEPVKTEITSPYNLGLFLTLGKYHMAREDHEDDEALKLARDYATGLRKGPEGLQKELHSYLEWREGVDLDRL